MDKKFESKFIDILKTFNTKDKTLQRFELYLTSGFAHKVSKKAILLFQIIQPHHSNYEQFTVLELFQKLYGEKAPFKAGTFKNLVSELYQAAKGFVAYLEYEQYPNIELDFLFEGLLKRRLPKVVHYEQQKAVKASKKEAYKDVEQLYEQSLLSRRINQYTTMYNSRNANTTLPQAMLDLDAFYLTSKLKYFVVALTWQRIIKVSHELYFFDEILQMIETNEAFQKIPIIKLYYHLTLALKHYAESPEHFNTAHQLLLEYGTQFSKYESRQLYTLALNYCRWKINEGDMTYAKKAVDLYKTVLDYDILYVGGYIRAEHFRNIVKVGIESQDLEWMTFAIDNYSKKIAPEHRKNIENYSRAALAFAQEDYTKAEKYLTHIYIQNEFVDFYYHIYYKTLLIQTLYELNNIEEVLKELEAFRLYFARNKKTPKGVKEVYQNFIKVVRKLTNRKTKTGYVTYIQAKEALAEKKWLLQKAKILDNTRSW